MNTLGLTPEHSRQLALDLKIDEIDDDAADRNISPDEALMISNSARDALEAGSTDAAWVAEYRGLREDGWPWRVAVFIAWAATPRDRRTPGTQLELARDVLGLRSDRVLRKWRAKNPAIDEAVAKLQALPLMEHRGEIIRALVESATTSDYKNHNDRKLALEMLGDYTPRAEAVITRDAPPVTADEMAAAQAKAKAFEAGDEH